MSPGTDFLKKKLSSEVGLKPLFKTLKMRTAFSSKNKAALISTSGKPAKMSEDAWWAYLFLQCLERPHGGFFPSSPPLLAIVRGGGGGGYRVKQRLLRFSLAWHSQSDKVKVDFFSFSILF